MNVFDFLVDDETPNASRISLGGSKEQMSMVEHAPPVFEATRRAAQELEGDSEYETPLEKNGYSYGTEPVATNENDAPMDYQTPAPKHQHTRSLDSIYSLDGQGRKSTDKKRKRHPVEDLDLTQARRPSQELDAEMIDAPPVLHSGLTGGLKGLLTKSKFPPSPEYSGGDNSAPHDPSPLNPIKKIIRPKEPSRGRPSSTLVKVRKIPHTTTTATISSRRTSDESRPRKQHRSQRPHGSTERPKRKLKAITYNKSPPDPADSQQQLVVYRTRAELFMSFVTKGPESESGCSINKALKRYHRERGEQGLGLGKAEEEKELWKSMRLRRNDRGEIVLFM